MRTFFNFILAVFVFCNTACAHLAIDRSLDRANTGQQVTVQTHSFVFGFLPARRLYQHDLCAKSQIETLEIKMTAQDVLIAIATLGMYIPQRILAVCRDEATASR